MASPQTFLCKQKWCLRLIVVEKTYLYIRWEIYAFHISLLWLSKKSICVLSSLSRDTDNTECRSMNCLAFWTQVTVHKYTVKPYTLSYIWKVTQKNISVQLSISLCFIMSILYQVFLTFSHLLKTDVLFARFCLFCNSWSERSHVCVEEIFNKCGAIYMLLLVNMYSCVCVITDTWSADEYEIKLGCVWDYASTRTHISAVVCAWAI